MANQFGLEIICPDILIYATSNVAVLSLPSTHGMWSCYHIEVIYESSSWVLSS